MCCIKPLLALWEKSCILISVKVLVFYLYFFIYIGYCLFLKLWLGYISFHSFLIWVKFSTSSSTKWQWCVCVFVCLFVCIQTDTQHTNTYCTHTHVGFYGLRGLSIGVIGFYTVQTVCYCPTPTLQLKLIPNRRLCISTFSEKNSLCMIYKCFELWGHWKCPHNSYSGRERSTRCKFRKHMQIEKTFSSFWQQMVQMLTTQTNKENGILTKHKK